MFDRAVVDSATFARESGRLSGTVAIASLARLHDMLFDRSGDVVYTLTGFVNHEGKPCLRLTVRGDVILPCQHCLGPVRLHLDSARNFVLVPAGEPLSDPADEAESVEQLYADPRLDVVTLVEDEVILSLPMVVGHEERVCQPLVSDGATTGKHGSPFSVLASLRRR